MQRTIFCLCLLVSLGAWADEKPTVALLDGPEVQPMRDGLRRVGCHFADLKALDAASLAQFRVLVICGADPPVAAAAQAPLERFLDQGGAILAVGRGAGPIIDLGLFDAQPYYMTGTTTHNAAIDAYHRLMFGFPVVDAPRMGTSTGVSELLRATQGPLMKLGPAATSILSAGGGYSLAAVQRHKAGWLILVGADPQGGLFFSDVDKSTRVSGAKLRTDPLLANAVAFLLDPHCNLIPNPGFEESPHLAGPQSHWEIVAPQGARHAWRHQGAAQGEQYLELVCTAAKTTVEARPLLPIAVQPGQPYRFECQYKSTAAWKLSWQFFRSLAPQIKPSAGPTLDLPPSDQWKRMTTEITLPADTPYARPLLRLVQPGELGLDEVTLQLE